MSLLDTPGHKDFSEDTYRALIAADSVVMVIDAANGVEDQTRKLFEVCRRHRLPILTFVNKFDRPARDPLELLDDLERTLGIAAAPVNWPIGSAERFRGVYDIQRQTLHRYEREAQGQYRAPVDISSLDDPEAREMIGADVLRAFPRVAGCDPRGRHAVRRGEYRAGRQTPVFFGSALDELRPRAVPSGARRARAAAAAAPERCRDRGPDRRALHRFRLQDPGEHGSAPSGSRRVRPRLLRPLHEGHGGVQQPAGKAAQGVARVPVLRPRPRDDQRRPTRATSSVSSTRGISRSATRSTPGAPLRFPDLPRFPAEHFGRVRLRDTRYKQFDEGMRQLEEEGLMQVFYVAAGRREPIVGVVGALQFDVIVSRLRTEYGVAVDIEPAGVHGCSMARESHGADAFAGRTERCGRGPAGTAGAPVWLGVGAAVLRAPPSRRAAAGRVAGRDSDGEQGLARGKQCDRQSTI